MCDSKLSSKMVILNIVQTWNDIQLATMASFCHYILCFLDVEHSDHVYPNHYPVHLFNYYSQIVTNEFNVLTFLWLARIILKVHLLAQPSLASLSIVLIPSLDRRCGRHIPSR